MAALFEKNNINGMILNNRLVRSATWEGLCDHDGRPTQELIEYYRTLAQGGVGLIVSGYTYVSSEGKQLPRTMGIDSDDLAPEIRALTQAVHDEDGKVCMQLVHVGGQTDSSTAGMQPFAPSAVKVAQFPEEPQEIKKEDMQEG